MTDYIDAEHTALATVQEPPQAPIALFGTSDPVETIERAVRVADALKNVVKSKGLISNIKGKEYPQVEAWQTLAVMLGVSLVEEWTRKLENGWEARCVVFSRDGRTIGAADAQCTRDEYTWKSRDDYALRSMAQTRATSKAARSVLGFVMVLAGYQATPAEEMPRDEKAAPEAPKAAPVPTAAELRALYADCRAVDPSLPESVKAWALANVPNYTPSDDGFRAVEAALRALLANGAAKPPPAPVERAQPAPAAKPSGAAQNAPESPETAKNAPMTDATRRRLMGALNRIGVSAKADRLAFAAQRGFLVASYSDLTEEQARALAEDATNQAQCPACGTADPAKHQAGCPEGETL